MRHLLTRLSTALAALFAPRPVRRGRLEAVRAVTFLEYALLAGIALLIFFVFKALFPGIFSDLLGNIRSALGL